MNKTKICWVLIAFLAVSVPFSSQVLALEDDYWPVSQGDTLTYNYSNWSYDDDYNYFDGKVNITLDQVHENGFIDYHTETDQEINEYNQSEVDHLTLSKSTANNLSLQFRNMVFIYAKDAYAQYDWSETFEEEQDYWDQYSSLYQFKGKVKVHGYEFELTRNNDNFRLVQFDIEYTRKGILKRYYREENWDINESEESWFLRRDNLFLGYSIMSITLIGFGVIGIKIWLMWKSDKVKKKDLS